MRHIAKGKAPETLRATAQANKNAGLNPAARDEFNQIDKGEVRMRLSEDQGGLCAYCMDRIDPEKLDADGKPTTRIAHWMPIDAAPSLALDWKNLLGSCSSPSSCDIAQKQAVLATNPTVVGHIAKLAYERDPTGAERLLLTSPDVSASRDIEALGLNKGDLPANRYAVWKAFLADFKQADSGAYGRPAWRAFFQSQRRNPQRLPLYLGVIEAKLR